MEEALMVFSAGLGGIVTQRRQGQTVKKLMFRIYI